MLIPHIGAILFVSAHLISHEKLISKMAVPISGTQSGIVGYKVQFCCLVEVGSVGLIWKTNIFNFFLFGLILLIICGHFVAHQIAAVYNCYPGCLLP